MKPDEIRRELLQQHSELRAMLDVIETIAKRARSGDHDPGDLWGCVARLSEAIHAHSKREEALLEGLIPSVDPFGDARVAIMDEEHKMAHERLDAAILGIPSLSSGLAAVAVIALVRLIREHMDREEAAFLNEHVLRDEAPE